MTKSELPAPMPEITQHSAAFWAATVQQRLVAGYCEHCDSWSWPPSRSFCPNCAQQAQLRQVSGRGRVHSWTVVARGTGEYKGVADYILAYVALEEGPTMLTNVIHVDPRQVRIDMPVTVVFVPTGGPDDPWLPRFEPAAATTHRALAQ